MFLLASLFVPFFVVEFAATGHPLAAVMVTGAGCAMLSCLWIYRHSRRLALAREVFLSSLFAFIVWEAFYFESIYSPGTMWLIVMPVVSVLLGSIRAGVIWVVLGWITVVVLFVMTDGGIPAVASSSQFGILYGISIGAVVLAIFLFVFMVDAARAKAYRNLVAANTSIRALAETDELTGLFNRRVFERELRECLQSRTRSEQVVVLMLDVDGLREVNDSYGHLAGDHLIQQVAADLSDLSRERRCILARIGGDEFAFVLGGPKARSRARKIAREAMELAQRTYDFEGGSASVSMSLGLASTTDHVDDLELLRRADLALHEAKRRGKWQVTEYDEELDATRARRVALAKKLEVAISRREVEVHYQPVVDARRREVQGVEALARWTGIAGEAVPPDEFIPIAEESGVINKLGLYVLERACRDAAHWGTVRLSVNLSPVQFISPTLVDDILRVLERTGFPPARLELEVTEGHMIQHGERVLPVLERLRSEGIKIALDDFGTGYSSIGYLRQYRFDRLKIDKSLVGGIVDDTAARGVIEATAALARSLSLDLTAEGVETEEQAKLLRLAGCSSLQGYLFGRPQSAEATTRLLANRTSMHLTVGGSR
jgi:diguanylate cyclase (GGDEF)-like protein